MFFSRGLKPKIFKRTFANEVDGANISTGIEHAINYSKVGASNKRDFNKEYKCIEYLNMNKNSYYDIECKLQKFRVPQPSNKQPDIEPKIKDSKS